MRGRNNNLLITQIVDGILQNFCLTIVNSNKPILVLILIVTGIGEFVRKFLPMRNSGSCKTSEGSTVVTDVCCLRVLVD